MDDEPVFTILEKDELTDMQTNLIESTATQLDVSPPDAALVLQHFGYVPVNIMCIYWYRPVGTPKSCFASILMIQSSIRRSLD